MWSVCVRPYWRLDASPWNKLFKKEYILSKIQMSLILPLLHILHLLVSRSLLQKDFWLLEIYNTPSLEVEFFIPYASLQDYGQLSHPWKLQVLQDDDGTHAPVTDGQHPHLHLLVDVQVNGHLQALHPFTSWWLAAPQPWKAERWWTSPSLARGLWSRFPFSTSTSTGRPTWTSSRKSSLWNLYFRYLENDCFVNL